MTKATLLCVLLCSLYEVQGWGYRYNYNPASGESNLWTYLPGHEQPVVYDYQPGQPWPNVYSVAYDGLLPGVSSVPPKDFGEDPSLYRYRGPDGKFRFKCKPDAYYNEYLKKCLWKPGKYYNKNRPLQQDLYE
ncbi:unnamed protein product [Orchesella dallaii]|uniref:Uncharacterized protein n=1 Tax=Orchesella dallaii TaxID=48710 RepID=A0ABP1R7Y6_9HEXA